MDHAFQKMKERFEKLDCASLCDASPFVHAFAPGLKPLHPNKRMMGRARTICCTNDYLTVIKALTEALAGEVLVVDGRRQNHAIFGELLAAEAHRLGLSGAVIDGAVRDTNGMRELDFPVYYRWTNPRAGRAEVIEPPGEVVSVCGVTVFTGDWIMGDADGIVVIPAMQVEEVLSVAEEIQKVEEKVLRSIRKGASLTQIMKFEEFRREHERDIRSKIEFHLSEK